MSIVKAENNDSGPATLDIQIEQGATFGIDLVLRKDAALWPTAPLTFSAWLATAWEPNSQTEIELTVTKTGVSADGTISVGLTAAQTAAIVLPDTTPRNEGPDGAPRSIMMGGWVLRVTEGSTTYELIIGDVTFVRDPRS